MKTMYIFARILIICLLFSGGITAQMPQNPCSSQEASQFDFWVGEWDLEWVSIKGEVQHGTNSVKKVLGGCVVEENFNGSPQEPLKGVSHSLYDEQAQKWKQTWVDNTGSYLDFVGEYKNGKMILSREVITKDESKRTQRMVFFNIKPNDFDWNWQFSDNGGKTWKVMWKMKYRRKNG